MSDSKKNQPEKKKRAQDDGWEERVKRKGGISMISVGLCVVLMHR